MNRQIGIMVLMPLLKFGYAFFSGWMDSADGTIVAHCEVNGKTCVITKDGETVTIDREGEEMQKFMEQNNRKINLEYNDPFGLAEKPMMNFIDMYGLVSGTANFATGTGDMTAGVKLISGEQPTVESFSQVPVTAINTLIKVAANNVGSGGSSAVSAATSAAGNWIKTHGPKWLGDLFEIAVNSADPRIGKGVTAGLSGNNFTRTFSIEKGSVAGDMFTEAFEKQQTAQKEQDAGRSAEETFKKAFREINRGDIGSKEDNTCKMDLEAILNSDFTDANAKSSARNLLGEFRQRDDNAKKKAVQDVKDIEDEILDEAGLGPAKFSDYEAWSNAEQLTNERVAHAFANLVPGKQETLSSRMKLAMEECKKLNDADVCGKQYAPYRQKTDYWFKPLPGMGFGQFGIPPDAMMDSWDRSKLDWNDIMTRVEAEEAMKQEAMQEAQNEGSRKPEPREQASEAGKEAFDSRDTTRQTDKEYEAELKRARERLAREREAEEEDVAEAEEGEVEMDQEFQDFLDSFRDDVMQQTPKNWQDWSLPQPNQRQGQTTLPPPWQKPPPMPPPGLPMPLPGGGVGGGIAPQLGFVDAEDKKKKK